MSVKYVVLHQIGFQPTIAEASHLSWLNWFFKLEQRLGENIFDQTMKQADSYAVEDKDSVLQIGRREELQKAKNILLHFVFQSSAKYLHLGWSIIFVCIAQIGFPFMLKNSEKTMFVVGNGFINVIWVLTLFYASLNPGYNETYVCASPLWRSRRSDHCYFNAVFSLKELHFHFFNNRILRIFMCKSFKILET